jgi:hypothetical protein
METKKNSKYFYPSRRPASSAKRVPGLLILFLVSLFFGSCNQDAIFYNISQEVKLLEPRIKGTPTNIVHFGNYIFVANRSSLHRYGKPPGNTEPAWDSAEPPLVQPGGEIWGLAATNDHLYVLTGGGLKRLSAANVVTGGGNWEPVNTYHDNAAGYSQLQTIYADARRLFAGGRSGTLSSDSNDYAILYVDDSDNSPQIKAIKTGVHLLKGAALSGTEHYLATAGSGIYVIDDSAMDTLLGDPIPNSGESNITGIIAMADNTVVAVNRNGDILAVTASEVTSRKNVGYKTTGALALWRSLPDPEDTVDHNTVSPKLLLVGIQGSTSSTSQTYTNGYREIELDETTGSLPAEISVFTPGDSRNPSVFNREKYTTSLGELPINHLFQAPFAVDKNMTVFAATHGKEGLWSYRQRSGDWQWNAEE